MATAYVKKTSARTWLNNLQQRLSTRSTLTIEDLRTKSGTTVDGQKYKGEKLVVSEPAVHIKLGNCPDSFR
jgi:hypothetical protein